MSGTAKSCSQIFRSKRYVLIILNILISNIFSFKVPLLLNNKGSFWDHIYPSVLAKERYPDCSIENYDFSMHLFDVQLSLSSLQRTN